MDKTKRIAELRKTIGSLTPVKDNIQKLQELFELEYRITQVNEPNSGYFREMVNRKNDLESRFSLKLTSKKHWAESFNRAKQEINTILGYSNQ